jgi:hypothetical protein
VTGRKAESGKQKAEIGKAVGMGRCEDAKGAGQI